MTAAAAVRSKDSRLGPAPHTEAVGNAREELLDDWQQVIDALRADPDIPLPLAGHQFRVRANGAVEVDRLAARLGVLATHNGSVHQAVRTFGLVDLVITAPALEARA